jgi:hypothetical protein
MNPKLNAWLTICVSVAGIITALNQIGKTVKNL